MTETTVPRVRTLPVQAIANRLVRGLLRTPGIAQLMGRRLIVVHVTGRKSGRRYVIPVAYTREGDDLLTGSPFGWGRNLRTGESVPVRLRGRLRQAEVTVYSEEADVVRLYDRMCRDNKVFASFNQVGFAADGDPKAEDLHAAWAAGARVFRFTPR